MARMEETYINQSHRVEPVKAEEQEKVFTDAQKAYDKGVEDAEDILYGWAPPWGPAQHLPQATAVPRII